MTSTDPTTTLDLELAEAGLDPRAVSAAVTAAVAEDLPGEAVTSAATLDPALTAWADLAPACPPRRT